MFPLWKMCMQNLSPPPPQHKQTNILALLYVVRTMRSLPLTSTDIHHFHLFLCPNPNHDHCITHPNPNDTLVQNLTISKIPCEDRHNLQQPVLPLGPTGRLVNRWTHYLLFLSCMWKEHGGWVQTNFSKQSEYLYPIFRSLMENFSIFYP